MTDIYRFGGFELLLRERRLQRDGEPVPLGARAFDLLFALVEGHDRLLSKRELMDAVWPGVVVEENNLTVQVSALRRLLGADALATVAGRGYRFTLAVEAVSSSAVTKAESAATPAGADPQGDLPLPDLPSIAVLPFINLGGDSTNAWFCDGLTDDLITELSRFRSLFVIARATAFTYKDAGTDVRLVGRELGVRYVLQGSIRTSSDRIRVSAHLADAWAGTQVWSERYDHVVTDLFDLQQQITGDIVAAIAPQIEITETLRARSHRPADRSSHEQAMQAWALVNDSDRDPMAREHALALAQSVIETDPTNALAWRTIAFAQAQGVYYDTAPQPAQAATAGLAAATRAVELDPADHHGYLYKGLILGISSRAEESLVDLRRAVELNANDVMGLALLGFMESLCGDAATGVPRAKEALRRSPRDPRRYLLLNMLAWAHFAGQDHLDAVAVARQVISERPSYPQVHLCLALALVGLGDIARAREAFVQARTLAPNFVQLRLDGAWPISNSAEYRDRASRFIRIAAGLDART